MKTLRTLVLISLTTMTVGAMAQQSAAVKDSSKTEYILKGLRPVKIKQIGIYVAPETQISYLDGHIKPLFGGSAMILLNQKLGIGLSGYSTGRGFRNGDGVDFRYGGVKVEYTFRPSKRFHFSVPVLLGMGSANDRLGMDNDNRNPQPWGGPSRNSFGNRFFVAQGGINLEGNLFKYAKVFVGANYRFAGIDNRRSTSTLDYNQVSGPSVNIGLKFGLFDHPLQKKSK